MRKSWLIFIFILGLSLFFRSFDPFDRFVYTHDNDLASWIVKDIYLDRHWRLIGQLTSSPGIFIGPLFYYLLVPLYRLTTMDPAGSIAYSWFIGLLATASVFWVFSRIFGSRVGLIGSFIHAVSYGISRNEREVVPTTPVVLWSVWFLYALYLVLRGRRWGLYVAALLLGLVWHIHLALALLAPLLVIGLIKNRLSFQFRHFAIAGLIFTLVSAPLLLFELRHQFIQIRALTGTLSSVGSEPVDHLAKFGRVIEVTLGNANDIFYWDIPATLVWLIPVLAVVSFAFLIRRTAFSRLFGLALAAWFFLQWLFFSFHPINLSEYYLNGLNILWILMAAVILSRLKFLGLAVLAVFFIYNLQVMLNEPVNHIGYTQKKALVQYIKADASTQGYPCVAVSFMTDRGYELGYRYWFFLYGMHVNRPDSLAPVYTIVFPHPRAGRLDATFGALGLVKPDYYRYTQDQIKSSCSGANSNLTDPMFGFTK